MDANHTAHGKRLVALLAVLLAFVCSTAAARAELLVQTPAKARSVPTRFQMQAVEEAADGNLLSNHSRKELQAETAHEQATDEEMASVGEAEQAVVLAALLLIPPPIDLITEIPTAQPDNTHPIVVGGPDLHIDTIPGGSNGQVLNTQSAPEPTTLVLGAIGSSVAFAGAWCRRRRSHRRAPGVEAMDAAMKG